MTPLYVFEDSQVDRLFPLTYSRTACELRVGAMTLLQRLQKNLGHPISGLFMRDSLAEIVRGRVDVPVNPSLSTKDGVILVNGRLLLLAATPWRAPASDSVDILHANILWMHLGPELAGKIDFSKLHEPQTLEALLPKVHRRPATATMIERPWDLLDHQEAAIREDFAALGAANHATLLPGVHLIQPEQIHLAEGVKVWPGAVLDAQSGPIIVGADTEIRANAVITGPVAIGERCIIRTSADIRENCSFGPNSRVGGEVSHTVFLGNASKQHHGFVGQTIVGEWANLGAGTTTSNLKNTYGPIRMPINGIDEPTGRQFLGSIIGDHAKLGIGTYLSTGSVVGFASHVTTPRPPDSSHPLHGLPKRELPARILRRSSTLPPR